MKSTLFFLLVCCLVASTQSQQQCMQNCNSCTNSTSCTQCGLGFFLVNNSFCAPCPRGCTNCSLQAGNTLPTCFFCQPPAQLNHFGQCFFCDPSCETCQETPGNCTSCKPGFEMTTIDLSNFTDILSNFSNFNFSNFNFSNFGNFSNFNFTGFNISDFANFSNFNFSSLNISELGNISVCTRGAECPIKYCLQCTDPTTGGLPCSLCQDGYFSTFQGCYPCKYSCRSCNLDLSIVAPMIINFWDVEIRKAFNITPTNPPTPPPADVLPPFLMNLDWDALGQGAMGVAFPAYLVLKVIEPYTSALNMTVSRVILQGLNFLPSLFNLTSPDQISRRIVAKINNVTRKNFTLEQLVEKRNQVTANMTTCTQCAAGFDQQTTASSTCSLCPPNCITCNGDQCQVCAKGYFVDNGVCKICASPCLTCVNSASACLSCILPYSFDTTTSTCILCKQPCLTCLASDTNSCVTCKRPNSFYANSTGGCYRCSQDLCLECDSADNSICTKCGNGASLLGGVCSLCPSNCASCSPPINSTVNATCYACNQGFSLSTTGCVRCGPGCTSCSSSNASICYECITGTYLNQTTLKCQKCRQGCLSCTSFQVCNTFDNGIVIIGNLTVSCRPGCKICDATSPDICTTCQQRFYLDSQNCKLCQPGCQVCSDATTCLSCFPGLIFVTGDCLKCEGQCLTCQSSNASQCLTCKRGYTLIGTDCVNQCQSSCRQCQATNSSQCLECKQGFALKQNGQCVKCLGSCSGSCDPRNISICLSCTNGFQLKQNKCQRCSIGCVSCLNGQCLQCAPEFKLSQDSSYNFICKQRCRPPCQQCSGTKCTKCQNGFTLSNNICSPDLSCNPTCQFCPSGTSKDADGICVACPGNCAACDSGVCFQCVGGFYIDASNCVACPAQCKTCFDSQTCDLCSAGYVKQILSMQTGVQSAVYGSSCIACDPNCKTCIVQPKRCTSCFAGFRLFSSRCAGQYTVGYVYELDIDYSNFLADSQSQGFVSAISTATGVNSQDNYIQFVRQGSTQIGGTISASDQSAASNIQSSLGSSLQGFTVLSSSSNVYYNDQVYNQQKEEQKAQVNIGLIVGVVIGGVVLIGIIIFVVYKIKTKMAIKTISHEQVSNSQMGPSIQEPNSFGYDKNLYN